MEAVMQMKLVRITKLCGFSYKDLKQWYKDNEIIHCIAHATLNCDELLVLHFSGSGLMVLLVC